mgnify:CR=1 FL=1
MRRFASGRSPELAEQYVVVSAAAESDELSDILPVLRVARLYEKDELTPVAGEYL